MMTLDLPTFTLGTPKQIHAATAIRLAYIQKLVDRGFDENDIQTLLSVRCVAKWWITNRDKLEIMYTAKHFKTAHNLVRQHGSVDATAEFFIEQAYQQELATAEYIYLITPMFKL